MLQIAGKKSFLYLALALALTLPPAVAAGPSASEGGPLNWDLTEIYPSDEAWETARLDLAGKIHSLDPFKGELGESAETLRKTLSLRFALSMQAERLSGYANMRRDEDLRRPEPQAMNAKLDSVLADLDAALAWIEPEILSIPPETLDRFRKEEPGLAEYARYLERLEKRRPHVLDAKSEQLLGLGSRLTGVGANIGAQLRNAEIPWKTVALSDGSELRVDPSGYGVGRRLQNRADRRITYQAFYKELYAFRDPLAMTLSATVQEHVFNKMARHYDSSLDAAVSANEVDPAVYRMLVREMNNGLPTLHRYLKLRKRILGVDELRYYDMYPPLVDQVSADYSWENSKKLVLDALQPLGKEYVARFRHALESGWIDVYPREGKRAGAYVTGAAYEVHPYMLLNHTDDYLSTSTLAHEGGHLMHSSFSQEANPYPTAGYAIFVAEVASTVNEVLLFRSLLAKAETDDDRLALLGNFLEGLRTTVFRQTMFAEFELATARNGRERRGDHRRFADKIIRWPASALFRRGGRGHEDRRPLHRGMGVHPALPLQLLCLPVRHQLRGRDRPGPRGSLDNRPGAREAYLAFLKSGSTKPPVELLKDAGVDMTGPEPIRAAQKMMNEVMDQIDAILAKKQK